MEENKTENTDSENGDNQEETSTEEQTQDAPEKNELEEKNRQLFERAKKAELESKELKAKMKELSSEETSKAKEPEPQSDEPDYAKISFLEQRDVVHPDDQKIVKDEAERLKLPLTDVLQMEHIKTKLQESKDGREAKEGMPKGKGRTGQTSRDDVDYYMDKPNELPEDQDLASKVVEARMNKHETDNKFSKILFKG